jgi:hypothetical protein
MDLEDQLLSRLLPSGRFNVHIDQGGPVSRAEGPHVMAIQGAGCVDGSKAQDDLGPDGRIPFSNKSHLVK